MGTPRKSRSIREDIMYCKVRCHGPAGTTAGIVLDEVQFGRKAPYEIANLYPHSEAGKLARVERSPFFATWQEAFDYAWGAAGPSVEVVRP